MNDAQTRVLAAAVAVLSSLPALAGTVQGVARIGTSPAAGVRVTLFVDSLSFFAETRTLADGSYQFAGVPAGTYRLGAARQTMEYQQLDVVVGAGAVVRDFALAGETNQGQWSIIGNTAPETFDATDIAILLPDGRVMFCHDTVDPILFNPVTGQSVLAGSSGQEQGCMNITLLADGRVIFCGGQSPVDPGSFRNAVPWVKAYNPATNTWGALPWFNLSVGRWYPGLARLNDGSLLAMGGGTRPGAERTATCERLDLSTMQWSYTGSLALPTEFSPSALLYTGEVLTTWSPPQLYNPGTGQFRSTGPFTQTDRGYPDHSDHSLIVMNDGRAVAIGVKPGASGQNTAMSEIYNPTAGTWAAGSSPALRRFRPEVVQLPDGRVVVAAGDTSPPTTLVPNVRGVVKWTDLYDPMAGMWRRMADMNQFREYHANTLLIPDGRVITTGGTVIEFGNPPTSADIEGFKPPYLFRGVRPQVTSLSNPAPGRGSAVSATIFPQTHITNVVLVGTGAVTHWVDAGVPRRLVLPVTQNGATISVTMPTDPNVLPLGYYMLFAMADDIPSVARTVRVIPGCSADFDGDGDTGTDFDIQAFFACLAGNCCATCLSADLDGDGDTGTDFDIQAFFRVLGGGAC